MLFPLTLTAQWSSNPMQNLGVGVAANSQVTPKMAAGDDGGCYIAWFDNRGGGYCVYLQRLNADGFPQFAVNGMLVSNHPQMTWLVDWDLTVDADNNAIIVFSDMRNAGNDLDVFAYKIAPDGTFLWGADGICLSPAANSDFEPAPKVSATLSGGAVVAWPKSGTAYTVCVQKISTAGSLMWGASGITITSPTGERIEAPEVVSDGGESAIIIWKNSTGTPWSPTSRMFAQKYSADGLAMWNPAGVLFYDLGHISAWTYPSLITDGSGGAFMSWYDSPSLSDFDVKVMHVSSAGVLVFPLNGVSASINSMDRLHMYPSLSYFPASNSLFVFWVEENFNQNQYGVYGQKLSPAGERLWGNGGIEFVGLGGDQISFVVTGPADGQTYVGYFEAMGTIGTSVKVFRANPDGTMQWPPQLLSSPTLGGKDDLLMSVNTENRAFLTWSDSRSDLADIYAQNINPNGTLGSMLPPGVEIELTPYGMPIVIPAEGGPFSFNIAAANNSTAPITLDIWTCATLPNGSQYGPIINVQDFTLPGIWWTNRDRNQAVPAGAPSGEYTYDAYMGIYPDIVYSEDHFTFTKSATFDGNNLITGWDNWGVDFSAEVEPISLIPISSILLSAYPNPFNSSTVITFDLPTAGYVKLAVYDILGQEVAVLATRNSQLGTNEVVWNAGSLPTGTYFIRLQSNEQSVTRKAVLLK